jgi:hypothetical protein
MATAARVGPERLAPLPRIHYPTSDAISSTLPCETAIARTVVKELSIYVGPTGRRLRMPLTAPDDHRLGQGATHSGGVNLLVGHRVAG